MASERAAPVLAGVGLGISAYNICTAEEGQRGVTVASEVGAWTGAILGGKGGAEVGALVGSFFPGAGTAIGAAVGGLVGAGGGALAGSKVGQGIYNSTETLTPEQKHMLLQERH